MRSSRNSALILFVVPAFLTGCATSVTHPERPVSAPFAQSEDISAEAPFGGGVSENILNYNRVAPYVATSGLLKDTGVAEAKQLGFQLIVDLRQPDEDGVDEEKVAAAAAGIDYLHLPFASDDTAWGQIDVIGDILIDSSNYPVLIHCGSANRAAAAWALYRVRAGVDPITAIEEAKAAGLTSRETFVRDLLGLSGGK